MTQNFNVFFHWSVWFSFFFFFLDMCCLYPTLLVCFFLSSVEPFLWPFLNFWISFDRFLFEKPKNCFWDASNPTKNCVLEFDKESERARWTYLLLISNFSLRLLQFRPVLKVSFFFFFSLFLPWLCFTSQSLSFVFSFSVPSVWLKWVIAEMS